MMAEDRTPIRVRLETEIKDEDQKQNIVVDEPGDYVQKGNAHIIRFTEKTEDETKVDNLVTIHPDKVIIRRTGPVRMNQVFREKQSTESVYHHQYGKFHLQTTTKTISFQESNDVLKGMLKINYDLEVNGQQKQRHRLSLRFKEEGQS
ncbi:MULTISPECIES: DUF1934 domain-containing protein [Pontibacillus]|uniref:DUF1934 domain-containing protein n=1 Tax=Pontibacillus chungwhensis TaxID=265426 RepID=A0ABY8UY38_9BACI|nr:MULTISPECIES: DUF1934 domain-containing protein [Pontibacillus]MCD5324021.1 DUF1934 domain-containing protein [Pontibacillus sp. HN14]WIF97917.1 DUF1934 domain-containing protein [Pontibacillus chungwhensis]